MSFSPYWCGIIFFPSFHFRFIARCLCRHCVFGCCSTVTAKEGCAPRSLQAFLPRGGGVGNNVCETFIVRESTCKQFYLKKHLSPLREKLWVLLSSSKNVIRSRSRPLCSRFCLPERPKSRGSERKSTQPARGGIFTSWGPTKNTLRFRFLGPTARTQGWYETRRGRGGQRLERVGRTM